TPNFPASYNIAPTQPIAVVARDREGVRRFRLMRWGLLPSFVKDPKDFPTLINARSEEVLVKVWSATPCAGGAASCRGMASINGQERRANGVRSCFARASHI